MFITIHETVCRVVVSACTFRSPYHHPFLIVKAKVEDNGTRELSVTFIQDRDILTVKSVESVCRTYPYKAQGIFYYRCSEVVGQTAVVHVQVSETEFMFTCTQMCSIKNSNDGQWYDTEIHCVFFSTNIVNRMGVISQMTEKLYQLKKIYEKVFQKSRHLLGGRKICSV